MLMGCDIKWGGESGVAAALAAAAGADLGVSAIRMTMMIPMMEEAARAAQVQQVQHMARIAPPPLTTEAAPLRPPSLPPSPFPHRSLH